MTLALILIFSAAYAQQQSWTADNGNGTFTNPLFYDEFSDPDILRVGDDYYLAGTTMHAVPGLVILHSKDLVNWENVAYCFDRFDFPEDRFSLRNHQEIYGQGIWAPCIRYANGQFYVFSNVNGKGLQCYTAKDIKGPWEHHNMKGNIYDLGVLFDDDGKIYAIHGYGEVKCTELKPDMSGPIDGTERVIIPEGNGVGEGHHMYKIDGMYYLISTDYMPNGRTLCSRSKSIWGPYETRVITADETYGYHAASLTQFKGRIQPDGYQFKLGPLNKDATACTNAHQGGIVQYKDGSWWALFMQDFHSIGRTVCLMPMTWEDGWPMVGLKGNLGRAPRTWFKPGTAEGYYGLGEPQPMCAPYDRNETFDGKQLGRVWQWNHNPDERMWSLKNGHLRLQAQPAEQLMWARNTLTQRVIGPKSITTVELYVKGMKDGDVAGLGNINIPCSWIGIVMKTGSGENKKTEKDVYTLRCFEQLTNDTIDQTVTLQNGRIWLRSIGDYDNDQAQYAYSTDGESFHTLGRMMPLSYQLVTFQGSRHALFAFNKNGANGGYAEFDNFTVEEPCADRSRHIPYGKTVRIINLATNRPAVANKHGLLYDTHRDDKSPQTQFRIIDRGMGKVALQCADGRYVKVYGDGLPGDVRFTNEEKEAEVFLWQDYLDHEFMLFSLKNHRYLGKSPTTGSPYSMDFAGPDPARRNGSVLCWEDVNEKTTQGGLKDAYQKQFMIGVAVNQRNVSDPMQSALIRREFNSMTAENDMKPQPTEPHEGQFNWERADRIADFCRHNGISLRGHCLVWHNQFPDWMYTDAAGNEVTKEVLLERIRKHIQAIVSRYKDIVYCWDVVNEAITDNPQAECHFRQSRLYKICGDDFIREAFRAAREADPKALLFYNDYNECDSVKSHRIYEVIKGMKADGVPIDGIGMQGHYNIFGPSEQEVDRAIRLYKSIVSHIHVTELDVRVNREMGGQLQFSTDGGDISDKVRHMQERQYARLFQTFRRHADVIDCVTFWNLSDRDSWLGAKNYPLPFDTAYRPKPVYDIIRDWTAPEKIAME